MLKKIDHIGIAVSDLQDAEDKYRKLTQKEPSEKETVASQKVETVFFSVGETHIELLKSTAPDSPIKKFIDKRGPGVHHICFEVEDIETAKELLAKTGFEFVDLPSNKGAGGSKVAFLHPKSTGGILFELVEYPK